MPVALATEPDRLGMDNDRRLRRRLHAQFATYALALGLFIAFVAWLEHLGMPRSWIGPIFLLTTVSLYAGIGVMHRTSGAAEYYVAGRRIPAFYNGMAMSADWMSAATFISLGGTLYLSGYGGLAYILGWTGGFVLMAVLLAPYLRAFGQYTVPDFLGARFPGRMVRLLAVVISIVVSFIYVVAQLYGVGLITSRLTGLAFEIGVIAALGGVLVCSFLGGMRAVTWTQVAQYLILLVAYLAPVVWLSVKQTGHPVPQLTLPQQLQQLTAVEQRLRLDPGELDVARIYQARADEEVAKLADVPFAMRQEREATQTRIQELRRQGAPVSEQRRAEKALESLPRTEAQARARWESARQLHEDRARPLGGLPPHAQPFAGKPDGNVHEQSAFEASRRNFLALVFCLMVGTAALPHMLVRAYTTPTVHETRTSLAWCLFFVLLVYLMAPALAVLVKLEIFQSIVGRPFDRLPDWMAAWNRVDPSLMSVSDVNRDGLLQLGEIHLSGDIVLLASPAIAGLPDVISGLVAAGALAAALSTADGLLLVISSALSHDIYFQMINPKAPTARRVAVAKALLLLVALAAAFVAAQKPADILFLVAAAFSLAASAFFPALVLGIFWKRANAPGVVAGMLVGFGLCVSYMVISHPWLRGLVGLTGPIQTWWDMQPISAGIFGVPAGFVTIVVISLLTQPPSADVQSQVDRWRVP